MAAEPFAAELLAAELLAAELLAAERFAAEPLAAELLTDPPFAAELELREELLLAAAPLFEAELFDEPLFEVELLLEPEVRDVPGVFEPELFEAAFFEPPDEPPREDAPELSADEAEILELAPRDELLFEPELFGAEALEDELFEDGRETLEVALFEPELFDEEPEAFEEPELLDAAVFAPELEPFELVLREEALFEPEALDEPELLDAPAELPFEVPELFADREDDFASPLSARCLFTVLAAISLARFGVRPASCSLSLTCSYWRSRFALQAFCGISSLPWRLNP